MLVLQKRNYSILYDDYKGKWGRCPICSNTPIMAITIVASIASSPNTSMNQILG